MVSVKQAVGFTRWKRARSVSRALTCPITRNDDVQLMGNARQRGALRDVARHLAHLINLRDTEPLKSSWFKSSGLSHTDEVAEMMHAERLIIKRGRRGERMACTSQACSGLLRWAAIWLFKGEYFNWAVVTRSSASSCNIIFFKVAIRPLSFSVQAHPVVLSHCFGLLFREHLGVSCLNTVRLWTDTEIRLFCNVPTLYPG